MRYLPAHKPKKMRYTERYWHKAQIESAKFRAAAICRWLGGQYKPDVSIAMRMRLVALKKDRKQ